MNKKKIYLFFIVFLGAIAIFGQASLSKRDSLEKKLSTAKGETRLEVLGKLVAILRRPDPEKSKVYFNEFEKLYFESGEPAGFKSNYFHNKGEMEMRDGNYAAAEKNLLLAIYHANKAKNYDMLWASYNSLGSVYQEQADLTRTLGAFLKANQVAEEHLDEGSRAGSAINLGVVYGEQGLFAEALKHFRYSLWYHSKFKENWGLGNCLNNVGQVHMFMGRADSAKFYFDKAMRVWEKVSDDYGIAMTSFNLATLDFNNGQYASAEKSFLKSLEISEKMNDQYGITQNLSALSSVYFKWGKEKEGLAYMDKSLEFSKKNNILASVRDNYKTRFEYFKGKSDFKSAMEAHEQYFYWYDSLNNSSKAKNLQELQSKFETEKKEKEILKQKAEIDKQQTQRSFLIAGIILVLIFLGYVFRSFRQKQKANIIITRQKKEVEQQKSLIEEKQKEILDSIHYARRIQHSLLPNEKIIHKLLQRLNYNK